MFSPMKLTSSASFSLSIKISLRLKIHQAQAKNFCRVLDIRVTKTVVIKLVKPKLCAGDMTDMLHDLSVVKHISDEIAVMYLWQCVERVPSKELFQNPLHPYIKALLSAIPIPDLSTHGRKKHPVLIRRTESIPSSTWKRAAYIRAIQAHGKRTLCFPA